MITFHKKEPFDLEAFYSNPQELPYPDHRIGNDAAPQSSDLEQFKTRQRLEIKLAQMDWSDSATLSAGMSVISASSHLNYCH